MKCSFFAAAAALVLGSAASAQAPATGAPADKGETERLICQVQEQVGSRFKRKVCLTAAQWDEKQKAHREFSEDIQSGTWGQESGVTSPIEGLGPQ